MFIRTAVTFVCFILAGFFVYLGMEWLNGDIGLTPWFAFPAALATALIPVAHYEYWIEELEAYCHALDAQCDSLISMYETTSVCTCKEPHCGIDESCSAYDKWHRNTVSDDGHDRANCTAPWCVKCSSPFTDELSF